MFCRRADEGGDEAIEQSQRLGGIFLEFHVPGAMFFARFLVPQNPPKKHPFVAPWYMGCVCVCFLQKWFLMGLETSLEWFLKVFFSF